MPSPPAFRPSLALITLLVLSGCEPLRTDVLHPPPEETLEPPAGGTPDAGGQPPDAGSPDAGQLPDAGSNSCWRTQQLAADVQYLAFTFDFQGVAHFAYNRGSDVFLGSHIYVGSTRPGDVITLVSNLQGRVRGIAVDSLGHRYLALGSNDFGSYAREWGTSWQQVTLSSGHEPVQLKLDMSAFVHMLFLQEVYPEPVLMYGTNRSGSWEGVGGIRTSVADLELDAQGRAHIAYLGDYGISYTYETATSWKSESLGYARYGSARKPALALDAEGNSHLLYVQGGWAYHATNRTGGWVAVSVGPANGLLVRDLKVDTAGNLHALLDNESTLQLAYVTLPAGGQKLSQVSNLTVEWEGERAVLLDSFLGWNAAGEVRFGYWYMVTDSLGQAKGNYVNYAEPCP